MYANTNGQLVGPDGQIVPANTLNQSLLSIKTKRELGLIKSFGTDDYQEIWDIIGSHLDIYSIEVNGVSNTFNSCWSDSDYQQKQIDMMRPGYDYSSR